MHNKTGSQEVQFVVFTINAQLYSFNIDEVIEILRLTTITTIPGISAEIEGVINLRGSIIPVLNLHTRFQVQTPPKTKKNRVVIVKGRKENIGLIVEEVKMVTKFDMNAIEEPSGSNLENDLFIGFAKYNGQVIGVLDLEKVLYSQDSIA